MTAVTPAKNDIHVEEVSYKSSISESTFTKIAGSVNWINQNATHILGEVKISTLTVAQFQAIAGTNWVLMNGQNVAGSDWATLTGNTNVPDMVTGKRFLRQTDSDGNILTSENEETKSHAHPKTGILNDNPLTTERIYTGWSGIGGFTGIDQGGGFSTTSPNLDELIYGEAVGGAETRPNNIYINHFIKINN
ncbi:MAG: hypothetical protein OEL89_00305 [Candidatus Peregrinibacteria bacterium]|nr:hypothetical protein [Candidatus Peregrinibacteria bacterium]